jgi:integrase
MATLLLAGLRCAEAIQLRPRDVDLRSSRIRALGKGPKERVVPIEPQLEAYPREFASSAPVERTVLLHARGPAARRQRMRAMVKRRGLKAGVNDMHPHLPRHTCLTA